MQRVDLLGEFMSMITYNDLVHLMLINATDKDPNKDNENGSSDDERERTSDVTVDDLGHPVLSTCSHTTMTLKICQSVVREIFSKAYSKFDFSCCL